MQYTANRKYPKPEGSDYVRISDLNQVADGVDSDIGDLTQLRTPTKTEIVAAINEAAEMGGGHPPYYNESTNTWWEWDQATIQYVDTGRRVTATVTEDSTVTLPEGEDAVVENVGTQMDARFKFSIPRGDKGEAARITGVSAITLDPAASAYANRVGNDQSLAIEFGIPQGIQGVKGDTGAKGDTGNKGDTGATGAVGPQGEQGPQGIQGIQGEIGPQGEVGPVGPKGADGVSGRIMDGVYNMPGVDGPYQTLPAFADTQEGDQYIVDDPSVDSLKDLYIHGVGGADWTISRSWGGVPGPKGDTGEQGARGEQGTQGGQGIQGERGPHRAHLR